jgi:hypothetical protein
MDKIATGSASDRRDLFSESATRLGMSAAVIEKDFWVCWILKRLFADPQLKEQMVFKGGTSLSKVYGLIDRFSEDIDLVLDWRLLGYGTDDGSDPYQSISSKTKQDQYNRAMNAKAVVYIRETLLGKLNQLFATVPGVEGSVDEVDPHTINIKYPAAFAADYILSNVRLEIGPLASWVPSGSRFIHPYAAESFPQAFGDSQCGVVAIDAERTFWEKATILHQEAHRTGTIPARYSRHYYDLYKLAGSAIKESSLARLGLLKDVVAFKERFYYSSWARYDLARPGSFRLAPSTAQILPLTQDYKAMRQMLFREPPDFAIIQEILLTLEEEINGLN